MIKCANGESIYLKHGFTLPRPYSHGDLIKGTKGIWRKAERMIYIECDARNPEHQHDQWESDAIFMKDYEHPIRKGYQEFGLRGCHGGMDYLVLRAFVEGLQNSTPPPIDVYDAAAWRAITFYEIDAAAATFGFIPNASVERH